MFYKSHQLLREAYFWGIKPFQKKKFGFMTDSDNRKNILTADIFVKMRKSGHSKFNGFLWS